MVYRFYLFSCALPIGLIYFFLSFKVLELFSKKPYFSLMYGQLFCPLYIYYSFFMNIKLKNYSKFRNSIKKTPILTWNHELHIGIDEKVKFCDCK